MTEILSSAKKRDRRLILEAHERQVQEGIRELSTALRKNERVFKRRGTRR